MVILQKPNPVLLIALAGLLLETFTTGLLHTLGQTIYFSAIIIWAYLEIVSGASWFRRVLGIVVLMFVLFSLFNQLN